MVSQYMHSPTWTHLSAVMHILRYLKGTCRKGFLSRKSENKEMVGFTNTDWASSPKDSCLVFVQNMR